MHQIEGQRCAMGEGCNERDDIQNGEKRSQRRLERLSISRFHRLKSRPQ